MGPGAADKHHGGLALGAGADLCPAHDLDRRHLLGDHLLDLFDQLLVSEVLGDLPSDLAVASAPMKLTLTQGMPYLVSSMSAT